jgi:pyruvate,water dikinase
VALRISAVLLVLMMVAVGYTWGRTRRVNPWKTALSMLVIGSTMATIVVLLGGRSGGRERRRRGTVRLRSWTGGPGASGGGAMSETVPTEVTWEPPGPGPWHQERAHLPAAVTALMQEVVPGAFAVGFAEAFAPFGVLLDSVHVAFVNGFAYMQPQPFDVPGPDGPKTPEQLGAEIGRRTGLAAEAFERRIWREGVRRWDEETKPAALARHRALADVDLAALTDDELRLHLHTCIDHLRAMWAQHHRHNGFAMIPVGDFVLHAVAWTGRDPVPMFAVFDGWSPVSSVLPPELEPVVEVLRSDPEARAVLDAGLEPADCLDALRSRVPALDGYLRDVGVRIAAGFDLTNPTARERPDIVIGRIRSALDHDPSRSRDRADAMAAELREATPAEHRAEFDDLLAEARFVYRLRDERGLYSDATAAGLLRLGLVELGRRLHERGRIGFPYDTLDVRSGEIDDLLGGADTPTAAELAARVARRKALSATGAPSDLGPPAPPPPPLEALPPPLQRVMAAVGFAFAGVGGGVEAPVGDASLVVGVAGSAGSYEGRARIVRNFDELMTLEDGDVLVTSATGESFNAFLHMVGAIVTDHGGFASHAAIMGREMGFPAVVGTLDATQRIPNGVIVQVDGAAGTVTILG